MKTLALVSVLTLAVSLDASGQDALSLYHWEAVPKRLLLNPAAPVSHRSWLSLPLVGHADVTHEMPWATDDVLGLGGATIGDLLSGRTDLNTLPIDVPAIIDGLGGVGEVRTTARVNLLSAGIRTDAGLFSLNVDQQLDAIASIGPSPVQAFYFGEEFVQRRDVTARGIGYDGTARLSFALGYQTKIADSPWRVGGHLKLIRTQLHTRLLSMEATTTTDTDGGSVVSFAGRQQVGGWADVFEDREREREREMPLERLLGGSLGFGLDLGVHYSPDERFELSASITDLGFQRLSDQVGEYGFRNRLREGDSQPLATRESVTVEQASEEAGGFSKDGRDSLSNRNPYTRPLPSSLYLGGQYRVWGESSVGVVTRASLRDGRLQTATALSLNVRPSRWLEANTSLSYSSVGGMGVGLGASAQLAVVQLYVGTDNVLAAVDPEGGRRFSAVAGLTFFLPEKRARRGPGKLRQRGHRTTGKAPKCYEF